MTLRDVTLCVLGVGLAVALGTVASSQGEPDQGVAETPTTKQVISLPQRTAERLPVPNQSELNAGNPLPGLEPKEPAESSPGGLNTVAMTENLIFARSVDGRSLCAHCNRTGTWSVLTLDAEEHLAQPPVMTNQVLLVRTNLRFVACSGLTGQWDSFPIDSSTKWNFYVEQDRCRVELGEVLQVFSAHSGKWSRMDFAAAVDKSPRQPEEPQVIIP